jgi:hypothetical protein
MWTAKSRSEACLRRRRCKLGGAAGVSGVGRKRFVGFLWTVEGMILLSGRITGVGIVLRDGVVVLYNMKRREGRSMRWLKFVAGGRVVCSYQRACQ